MNTSVVVSKNWTLNATAAAQKIFDGGVTGQSTTSTSMEIRRGKQQSEQAQVLNYRSPKKEPERRSGAFRFHWSHASDLLYVCPSHGWISQKRFKDYGNHIPLVFAG